MESTMLPPVIQRQVDAARAVAENIRATAAECRPEQTALRERWLQAAQTIDRLIALVESAHFVAKLNHDVIIARAQP